MKHKKLSQVQKRLEKCTYLHYLRYWHMVYPADFRCCQSYLQTWPPAEQFQLGELGERRGTRELNIREKRWWELASLWFIRWKNKAALLKKKEIRFLEWSKGKSSPAFPWMTRATARMSEEISRVFMVNRSLSTQRSEGWQRRAGRLLYTGPLTLTPVYFAFASAFFFWEETPYFFITSCWRM